MPGPVFRHEMLSVGRRSRFVVMRTLIGLLMLIVIAISYSVVSEATRFTQDEGVISIRDISQIMAGFYLTFAFGTIIGVIAITPAIVAGAISSERERKTIEYLFTSQLTNSEIILDKVLARLLTIGQMVIVTLPILAILRFMGGVPGEMLLWHFVILFSGAMMCLSLSLVASTWNERTRQAISNAYSWVFLWLIGGGLSLGMASILDHALDFEILATPFYWLGWALFFINPFVTLTTYGGVANGGLGLGFDAWHVAAQCGVQLLVAFALITICALNIRRVHVKNAGKAGKTITKTSKVKRRVSPFQDRPMLWKEMFTSEVKKSKWNWLRQIVVGILALAILVPAIWNLIELLLRGRGAEDYASMLLGIHGGVGALIILSLSSRAASAIPLEKERDTWLSLMATPISASEIIWAKLLGTLYAYRWHFGALLFLNLLGILLSPSYILSTLLLIVILLVVSFAAAMVGIRISLGMESTSKAITSTTAILLAIGGGYLMLVGPMLAFSGGDESILIIFSPCIPFLFGSSQLPVFTAYDWDQVHGVMYLALLLGTGGYLALAIILFQSATNLFDILHGRAPNEWRRDSALRAESQVSKS